MKRIIAIAALSFFSPAVFSQEIRRIKIDELSKMIDTSSAPLIINFWASWCQPCVHEIPWFEKAIAEKKDKNIRLVLVSLDFAADYKNNVLKSFVKKQGYASTVVWLDETNADKFCPKIDTAWDGAIPVTLMVNNKKKYRQFYNSQLREERFKLELAKLVD